MKRLSLISLIISLLFVFSCEDKVEKDTTPPSLTITSPSNGETVSDKVVIKVTTEDDKEVSKVEFYIDDSLHVTDENSPYEYEWDTNKNHNGEFSIKIISYDESENLSEKSITVSVFNMKILFTSEDLQYSNNIYIMDTSGNNKIQLSNIQSDKPQYSPNGSKISYLSTTDKWLTRRLEIMDQNGENKTTLTEVNSSSHPIFSPDGKKILYLDRTDNDNNKEIYIINIDGSGKTNLTNNESEDYESIFTPDGKKIVYNSIINNFSNIFIMDSDGSNQTKLTNHNLGNGDWIPSISPDGNKILLQSSMDGQQSGSDIYTMNIDGSNIKRVTMSGGMGGHFTPDGKQIVYVSREMGSSSLDIYIINTDGSNKRNLTNSPDRNDNSLHISEDGNKILFISNYNDDYEVYMMNIDGSNQINLSNTPNQDEMRTPQFQPKYPE